MNAKLAPSSTACHREEREQVRAGIPAPETVERMARRAMAVHYSTGEEDWLTPPSIIEAVEEVLF